MSPDDTTIDESLSVRQDNLLDTLPVYIATAIFLLTIVLATIQVLLRQIPVQIEFLFWTEPLARYLLIVMTYLGTAIAIRNSENVKIDLFQRWLQQNSSNLYHIVTVLISLCVLFFVYAALHGAVSSMQDAWNSGTNLPYVTYGMIHATIAASIVLMGIYTLYELFPYAKLVAVTVVGGDYSVETRDSERIDDEPAEQLKGEEASAKAQELMGLSEADDTDSDDDDAEKADVGSNDRSNR